MRKSTTQCGTKRIQGKARQSNQAKKPKPKPKPRILKYLQGPKWESCENVGTKMCFSPKMNWDKSFNIFLTPTFKLKK